MISPLSCGADSSVPRAALLQLACPVSIFKRISLPKTWPNAPSGHDGLQGMLSASTSWCHRMGQPDWQFDRPTLRKHTAQRHKVSCHTHPQPGGGKLPRQWLGLRQRARHAAACPGRDLARGPEWLRREPRASCIFGHQAGLWGRREGSAWLLASRA